MTWEFIKDYGRYGLNDVEDIEGKKNTSRKFCDFSLNGFSDNLSDFEFRKRREKILMSQSFEFYGLTEGNLGYNYWLRLDSNGLVRRTMGNNLYKAKDDVLCAGRELDVIELGKRDVEIGSFEDFSLIGDYVSDRFYCIAKEILVQSLSEVRGNWKGDYKQRQTDNAKIENREKIFYWDRKQRQISEVFFNLFYRNLRVRGDFDERKVDFLASSVFGGLKKYENVDLLAIFKNYIPDGSDVEWVEF